MSAGAVPPPAGVLISERALLSAQAARVHALERLGESQRDAELRGMMTAALAEGPETYDSAIRWAEGRVQHGVRNPRERVDARIHVPRANRYVALFTDLSRRWRAGEVGAALPAPDKYDALLDFGEAPLTSEERAHPILTLFAERRFYFHAEAITPFTEAMLPGPGEAPAYRTFEVSREVDRQRGSSVWRLIGWLRAPDQERAVAAAQARWAARPLRIGAIGSADVEVTGGPLGREQPAELLRAWKVADRLSHVFFDDEGHDKDLEWGDAVAIPRLLEGFGRYLKAPPGAPTELVAAAALVNRLRAMLRGTGEAEVWDARADIRDLLDMEGFRP